jgi:hypothetical protein
MSFTPNRRTQTAGMHDALSQQMRSCVILALGAHSNQPHYNYGPSGSLNGLMSVWDSWIDNFFSQVSNTTSLIMLLDERDFRRQNYTTSRSDYVDIILHKNMGMNPVECLNHYEPGTGSGPPGHGHHRHHGKKRAFDRSCNHSHYLSLDQGYYIYSYDYSTHPNVSSHHHYQSPLIVFASIFEFPKPDWAKNEDEEYLYVHWRPRRLNRRYPTNYGYVKMTNWYAYHMLNLQLIDYFDYGIKLDNDVSFVAEFPISNIPLQMSEWKAKMLITTQEWYHDDPRICQGIRLCLNAYLQQESQRCAQFTSMKELHPGGQNYTAFWENNMNVTFRSHFIIFWFGLYASPQVKSFAKYWNQWDPRGMWDYRWGDQQYWPRPLQLFGNGHLDEEIYHDNRLNSDNEKLVVHKLWPLQWTVPFTNYFNISGSDRATRRELYAKAAKKFIK